MARLKTIGFETTPVANETNPQFEGSVSAGAGASASKETTIKRSGTASRKFDSGASNQTVYSRISFTYALGRGIYARSYFSVPALPSSNTYIARLSTTAGENYCLVRLTSAGKIVLCDGAGTQIGSESATTIAVDTWYRLEVYGNAGTGAVDDVELKLEGTTVASATDQAYVENAIDRFDIGFMAAPGANKVIYFDDLAINDDQGASQNSWPGAGNIIYLNAISDNSRGADWTAGAGGTSNLYEAVNNDPPAGLAAASATNTSQIKNTNTSDVSQSYDVNIESYSTGGLSASDTITLVQAVAQTGSSNTLNVVGGMEIVSNPAQGSEATIAFGNSVANDTYATGWYSQWATPVYSPSITVGTQPVLRIGRRPAAVAAEAHVCGMRIAVEYIPGIPQTFMPRSVRRSRSGAW